MKKKLLILFVILSMAMLVACGNKNAKPAEKGESAKQEQSTESGKVAEIKKKGKLVLGTCADYPPMEWIKYDGAKEEYVGVDIEIAKAIAKELGVELEVKNMAFEGLINSLNAGDLDIVLAGMVATPEREKAVDFSKPYYSGAQVLLVRKGDEGTYKSIADLKGKKIGTQLGTIQQNYAEKEFGGNVTALDMNNNLILELKNKTLDCLFLAELPAKQFAAVNPDLVVVQDIGAPNEDGNGVAVKKGDADLLEVCNKVIQSLQDSNQIQKWFDQYIEESTKEVEASK